MLFLESTVVFCIQPSDAMYIHTNSIQSWSEKTTWPKAGNFNVLTGSYRLSTEQKLQALCLVLQDPYLNHSLVKQGPAPLMKYRRPDQSGKLTIASAHEPFTSLGWCGGEQHN